MRTLYFLLLITLIPKIVSGQDDMADQYFNEGLKYFQTGDYEMADSLFEISIKYEESIDAYFNRALCKYHLNDICGYCNNIYGAALLGDTEGQSKFDKFCLIDATENDLQGLPPIPLIGGLIYDKIKIDSCGKQYFQKIYSDDSLFVASAKLEDDDWIFTKVDEPPILSNNLTRINTCISKNIRYPVAAKENGIQGIVWLKFIISKDGTVRDIEVITKIGGGCDEEAVRVMKMLPKLEPVKLMGTAVDFETSWPIRFTLL